MKYRIKHTYTIGDTEHVVYSEWTNEDTARGALERMLKDGHTVELEEQNQ